MIKKIKWHNHAILGNLELDFTKPDGTIYDTIVLAGENGTGKTTVLETLSTFLNLGSIEPFEYINYIADGIPYTIAPNPDDNVWARFCGGSCRQYGACTPYPLLYSLFAAMSNTAICALCISAAPGCFAGVRVTGAIM